MGCLVYWEWDAADNSLSFLDIPAFLCPFPPREDCPIHFYQAETPPPDFLYKSPPQSVSTEHMLVGAARLDQPDTASVRWS